jgi:RND family efflux transporter MFP subunit
MLNRMTLLLLAGMAGALLTACGETEAPPPPASRPVKIYTVEGLSGAAIRRFPGTVQASERAELSFRVPGRLQEILVREGDSAKEGDLLARLDPTDYQIALDDRQATFDNAQRNFNRAKELVSDGNISKLDYDRMEAQFRTARAALTQAQQNLDYTFLRAPFDGSIGRREVENFEDVVAKQTIFSYQNTDFLDIMIDLPEALVRSLTPRGNPEPEARETGRRRVVATARFEGRDGSFPLTVKEVATKANPQTQTFRVTLTMDAPEEFTVLPGMTATVEVDFSGMMQVADSTKWVPQTAVQADSGLHARVWVLDPETMTVSGKPVTIGRLHGSKIEVTSGLVGGEEIVTVGAQYLAEGMHVTRMPLTEQAVPREDDPA